MMLRKNKRLYKLLSINDREELESIVDKEPLLKEYRDKIVELSKKEVKDMWTETLERNTREADAYMTGIDVGEVRGMKRGIEQGIEQGITRGIKQGIEQGRKDMIIGFYKQNVPIDVISNAAGLTENQVLEIISKNQVKVA